ncbi:MAG: amino terminal protease family [Planctomycetota bacterium]|nr:amino terminal protease family [Planctomycetota bacterium]
MACLVFVLPMLAAYEIGVALVGGTSADAMRTGADAWMRQAMAALGLRDRWLSPLCLVGAMLAWQAFHGESWKLRLSDLLGMAMESLVLAIALIGVSRLVDLGFDRLDVQTVLQAGPSSSRQSVSAVIGFLGAGVYEEALFRLALIPAIYGSARLIHTPEVLAGTVAVTGSALLFSLAHHAGAPGESFTWFAFIFRWLAGIFFAWVFLVRGFGVAVGTHAAYDVLVGWVGLHF